MQLRWGKWEKLKNIKKLKVLKGKKKRLDLINKFQDDISKKFFDHTYKNKY